MKNLFSSFLWLLLGALVIAIYLQRQGDASIDQIGENKGLFHKILQLTEPKNEEHQQASLYVDFEQYDLAVQSHATYRLGVTISSNRRHVNWQVLPVKGLRVSVDDNGMFVIRTLDISFEQETLVFIISNGEVSEEHEILLTNLHTPHIEQHKNSDFTQDVVTDHLDMGTEHLDMVTSNLSGTVSFDRLTFEESIEDDITSYQFDPDNPQINPARFVKVNLRNSDDKLLATTYTNALGYYDMEVNIDNDYVDFYLEVVAQMKITDERDENQNSMFVTAVNQGKLFLDNTNRNRVYVVNSSPFLLKSGDNFQDIHLRTGWNASLGEFEPQYSAAQPFAILDSLAKGFLYLFSNDIPLPTSASNLTVYWSQDPDTLVASTGFYNPASNLIYISGINAKDTKMKPISTISEWNEHTILHEFGHYYLSQFIGRDDTQAGRHTAFGMGSLTLALSEGLANSIAKTVLKDWQDKQVSFDITKKRFVTSTKDIINDNVDKLKRTLVNQYGQEYQRPFFDFSPFIEETVSYFILSIIDPRSEYSARTTKLSRQIGMNGLHLALQESAQYPSLLTVYSLAQALKNTHPYQETEINRLGEQLELNLHDIWGNNQLPLLAHVAGLNNKLLPEEVQYPFYQQITETVDNEIAFNGALQSISAKRPGTLRYLTFTPRYSGVIQISILHAKDSENNLHRFSFDVLQSGVEVGYSLVSKKNPQSYSIVDVNEGETYIIRVFDTFFEDNKSPLEETVTTTVKIHYR